MKILDKTFLSEDEGYDLSGKLSRAVEAALDKVKLDPYNHQYVLRVTLDQIDEAQLQDDD